MLSAGLPPHRGQAGLDRSPIDFIVFAGSCAYGRIDPMPASAPSSRPVVRRSRFQNCFYYFRGPTKKASDSALEQQLEDNATKALINVLDHSSESVTQSFLQRIAKAPPADGEPALFFLQGGPGTPAPVALLLGISLEGRIDPASWGSSDGGSRVDAGVHIPGRLTLLIETKVVAALDGGQLNRHAQRWNIPAAERSEPDEAKLPREWRLATWAQVHSWAREAAELSEEQPSRFLVEQLAEFLELAGLAPTWVLRPEHFEYFTHPPSSRDPVIKEEIKTRLRSLWAQVEVRFGEEEFRRRFGGIRVGNVGEKDGHAWAQTHETESAGPANLTIELYPTELTLNIVGWFKEQGEALERWLLSEQGQRFVRTHPEYELVVFVVRGKASKGGKVMWKGAPGDRVDRLRAERLAAEPLRRELAGLRAGLKPKSERLGFHYRQAWPRERAIDNEEIVGDLTEKISGIAPHLEAIRAG